MRDLILTQKITSRESLSVKLYLQDVAKSSKDSLTPEQEVELFTLLKNGSDEEKKYAKNIIVSKNLRFVISVAKQYQYKNKCLSDLISEGNIGLLLAIDRFDINLGYKFITFAVWWIRKSISSFITSEDMPIRLPLNKISELGKIKKINHIIEQRECRSIPLDEVLFELKKEEIMEELSIKLKITPTENQIYDILEYIYLNNKHYKENGKRTKKEDIISLMSFNTSMNIDNKTKIDRFEFIKNAVEKLDLRFKNIEFSAYNMRDTIQDVISIDSPFNKKVNDNSIEDDILLSEMLEDKSTLPTDFYYLNEDQKIAIQKILSSLNPKYRNVMEHLYGMNGKKEKTLEETSVFLNITKERVRQINKMCLCKLQRNNSIKDYKIYLHY